MTKKKSVKDTKKLEDLKNKIESQTSKKEKDIEIEKPKKKIKVEKETKTKVAKEPKPKKERKSSVRKKRQRKVKEQILHEYIPEQVVLTEEEKEELSKELNYKNFPHILVSDPGIRHLEVKVGSVIKIKRFNPKIGDIYYYRIVVND